MSPPPSGYDVALSFAGEDRDAAESVAALCRSSRISVFYDAYETADLWGKDLAAHLTEVYCDRATFCVVFVSQHYARKLWTSHELRAAQSRAFRERREYLLPIRMDDTEVPGLLPTVGYLSWAESSPEEIRDLLLEKLRHSGGGAERGQDPGWHFEEGTTEVSRVAAASGSMSKVLKSAEAVDNRTDMILFRNWGTMLSLAAGMLGPLVVPSLAESAPMMVLWILVCVSNALFAWLGMTDAVSLLNAGWQTSPGKTALTGLPNAAVIALRSIAVVLVARSPTPAVASTELGSAFGLLEVIGLIPYLLIGNNSPPFPDAVSRPAVEWNRYMRRPHWRRLLLSGSVFFAVAASGAAGFESSWYAVVAFGVVLGLNEWTLWRWRRCRDRR